MAKTPPRNEDGEFISPSERNRFQRTGDKISQNKGTSAAIAGGVLAAAAGAGAFLFNRKKKLGTATGHAGVNEDVEKKVEEMNSDV